MDKEMPVMNGIEACERILDIIERRSDSESMII